MNLKYFIPFLIYCSVHAGQASAEEGVTFEHELDAYYSNISWTKGFKSQKIPVIKDLEELDIYKKILQDSFKPDFLVFEISVNPLPVLGVYLRKNYASLYSSGSAHGVGGTLIEAVTTGFEEPFALSLFAGRVISFAPPDGLQTKGDNRGYIGYLLSVGAYHIKQNILIPDNWAEIEWKIKGNRETSSQYLSWSLRAGAKFHSNPEISDSFMIAIRRNRIDFLEVKDAFMRNIGFDYRLEVLQKSFKPSRQTLIVDKHWPLDGGKLTISLGFGVIWEGAERYLGELGKTADRWSIAFRPNIKF